MPSKLPQWEGEAATLCALDASLHPLLAHSNLAGTTSLTHSSAPGHDDQPTAHATATHYHFSKDIDSYF